MYLVDGHASRPDAIERLFHVIVRPVHGRRLGQLDPHLRRDRNMRGILGYICTSYSIASIGFCLCPHLLAAPVQRPRGDPELGGRLLHRHPFAYGIQGTLQVLLIT